VITDWAQLPLVVDWMQVGELIGASTYESVRGAAKRGLLPPPSLTHPMRWYRSDLERNMRFTTVAQMRRSA